MEIEAEDRRELGRSSLKGPVLGLHLDVGGGKEKLFDGDDDVVVESPVEISPATSPLDRTTDPPLPESKQLPSPIHPDDVEQDAEELDKLAMSDCDPPRRHSSCASLDAPIEEEIETESSSQHRRSRSTPHCSLAPLTAWSQTMDSSVNMDYPAIAQSDPGHTHISTNGSASPGSFPIMLSARSRSFAQALHLRGQGRGQKKQEGEVKKRIHSERSKLMFTDYLIKPVQRICKYPLLLEQLRSDASEGGSIRVGSLADEHANTFLARTMAAVRSLLIKIDDARMKVEVNRKSQIVAERLVTGCSSPSFISSHSAGHGIMSSHFLEEELGDCLLVGGLDIVEWVERGEGADRTDAAPGLGPGVGHLKTRYLGVFLYTGGFLIFAKPQWIKRKTGKNVRVAMRAEKEPEREKLQVGESVNDRNSMREGKEGKLPRLVYEPRHWFALEKERFELREVGEGEGTFVLTVLFGNIIRRD